MSLILDALRKMEQERKSRLGGSGDLRPEVLRYRAAAPQPRRGNLTLIGGAAVALLAVGVVGGVVWQHAIPHSAAPAAPVIAQAAPPAPAALPTTAAPAPVAVPSVPAPAAAPGAPALPPSAAPALRSALPQVMPPARPGGQPAQRSVAAASGPPAVVSEQRSAVAPAPAPAAERSHSHRSGRSQGSAEGVQAAPADVTISGIAWQEERAMRRAVVNGTLVGEGAEIAGARVVEIREEKVRFSRGGQSFEVPYTTNLGTR